MKVSLRKKGRDGHKSECHEVRTFDTANEYYPLRANDPQIIGTFCTASSNLGRAAQPNRGTSGTYARAAAPASGSSSASVAGRHFGERSLSTS